MKRRTAIITVICMTAALVVLGRHLSMSGQTDWRAHMLESMPAAPEAGPARGDNPPNIILIVIDALRKDHVSAYGYDRKTTPVIDSLASDGLLVENAVSQAPWTAPSVASLFTSKYPSQTGVGAIEGPDGKRDLLKYSFSPLRPDSVTLADLLARQGYRTSCVSANHFVNDDFGMLAGFERKYQEYRKAGFVVDKAMEYIDKDTGADDGERPAPFFLYVHFMDVHTPVEPPPPYDTYYPTLDSAPHNKLNSGLAFAKVDELGTERFRIFKSHSLALYDGALLYTDTQIGRLVEYLKKKGLYRNTVIVVTADHGEEFWDHSEFESRHLDDPRGVYGVGHGHTLFGELTDVPLIISGRGIRPGREKRLARLIDVMPTILHMAGAEYDLLRLEGEDLLAGTDRRLPGSPTAFSEDIAYGIEKKSLQDGRYKYIRGGKLRALFDRADDPHETRDISLERADIAARMDRNLDVLLARIGKSERVKVVLGKDDVEKFRSVGYMQ